MTRAFVVLAALTCVAAAPALAVDTPAALGKAEGIYTPRAGIWEFSLTAPAFPLFVTATPTTRGVGVNINTGAGGGTATTLGLGAALGYAMTDLVEVGGAFGFGYTSFGGNIPNQTVLNIEPFVKANFGSSMARDSRINPFVLAALPIGYADAGNGGTATFTIEIAGGAEFMVTHTWGLSVYVPVSFLIPTAQGSSVQIGLGIGYGLVAYFN